MPLDIDELIPATVKQTDEPLALVVSVVMYHKPEVAVDCSHKFLGIGSTLTLLQLFVVEMYAAESSPESAVADVDAPRLDHSPDIKHTLLIRLDIDFLGMQRDVEDVAAEVAYLGDHG